MKGKRLTTVAGALALLLAPMAPAFADLVSQAPATMCSTNSTQASSDNDKREVAASVVIGSTLYFGGKFNQVVDVDGTVYTRNHLAACSIATGHVLPWDPNMEPPTGSSSVADVYALVANKAGTVIYAGGAFDRVGGQTVKGGLVALDPNPNVASPAKIGWGGNAAPGISSNSIKALALSPDESTLYVGGTFTKAGAVGQAVTRVGAAAFSTTTGALLDWAPSLATETEASCPPDDPTCVEEAAKPVEVRGLVARSDKVIAIGYFKLPGTTDDSGHMAAFSTTTGSELSWDEKPEWPIISIWGTATSDRIYVGGAGQGVSKNTVMAIDPADGKKKWQIYGDGNMQAVYSFGGALYVGGHFHFIGNKDKVRSQDPAYNRETLAAFTEGQDKPLEWNPGTNNAGNGVYSFSSGPGGLVAGGSFSRVAGAKQMGLARFAIDFPTVASSSPTSLGLGTTDYPVTVTGTKFVETPTLSFGDGVTVQSVHWVSPTQVVATITVASNAVVGPRDVIVTNPSGDSGLCKGCLTVSTTPPPPPPPPCPPNCPQTGAGGYHLVASDGGIFAFGDAQFYGSTGNLKLAKPIVGMAETPSGKGYWLLASDGGVFAFGDAAFFGSTGNIKLAQPIVGMASTPAGKGYWMVASDGGVFAFGDAKFFGSTGNIKLARPIVGMATTPSGNGYWMVASDGGVFAFGDAAFQGSTGNLKLAKPIVGMTTTKAGKGYWMVASDGGIFAFGDASFKGSTGNIKLAQPIVGMTTTTSGGGYYMVASDGGIFAFGDASFKGSTGNIKLARPIVGMASK